MAYTPLAAIADATKAFATDLISGVFFSRIKIAFGVEGAAVDVSAANPLPVAGAVTVSGTVPVSGAFFQATQPVSIAGAIAVTGPVTDAQLRATALPVTGTFFQATQPVSAASLPLPSGAATAAAQTTGNASLTSLDGKFAALVNGRSPVEAQTKATTTRAFSLANAVRQSFTAASTAEIALPVMGATREIRFAPSARCWIKWGATGLSPAAAEAASFVLEANMPEVLEMPAGATHFRVIRDTADGSVLLTPVV